jgi:hypothetical protein
MLAAVGVDPSLVDARRVLAAIAVDAGAAPTARVRAAVALLRDRKPDKPPGKKATAEAEAAAAAGGLDEWLGNPAWPNGRRPGSA